LRRPLGALGGFLFGPETSVCPVYLESCHLAGGGFAGVSSKQGWRNNLDMCHSFVGVVCGDSVFYVVAALANYRDLIFADS
jgi:hypothetical protein